MMRFDMRNDQFPLITTRQIPFNSVLAETLWFISGDTNNENLVKEGCTFWTPWAATLDSALIRQGRTFDIVDFRNLTRDEAKVVADEEGLDISALDGNSIPLADVFGLKRPSYTRLARRKKIKFGF